MMTKIEAYKYCQNHGASFIANVVLSHHQNPARKLKCMAALIQAGHTVSLGTFSIDTLVIDGRVQPWEALNVD
jgi:hypothetical protein